MIWYQTVEFECPLSVLVCGTVSSLIALAIWARHCYTERQQRLLKVNDQADVLMENLRLLIKELEQVRHPVVTQVTAQCQQEIERRYLYDHSAKLNLAEARLERVLAAVNLFMCGSRYSLRGYAAREKNNPS